MFLHSFTELHAAALASCTWVSLDLETTALTPSSPPTVVGSKKIGGVYTRMHYEKLHGASLNCQPRHRVFGLYLPGGSYMAWDLDSLDTTALTALKRASIHDKTVFGHNLSFDFMWLNLLADVRPRFVVDTMLLMRSIMPGLAWKIHAVAAQGNEEARALIDSKGAAEAYGSLNALCISLLGHKLEKAWQQPHNWCVKTLSPEHYAYVLGDLSAPVDIVRKLGESHDPMMALEALLKRPGGDTYRRIWSLMPLTLASISRRGMPLSLERVTGVQDHRRTRIATVVPQLLKHIPGLTEHSARLASGVLSTPAEIKKALAAYAKANGCELEDGDNGVPIIASKKVKLTGANRLEGWELWDTLQHSKKAVALCDEYRSYSLPSPTHGTTHTLLHPIISPTTVTLRCASGAPNVQNMPRPEADLCEEVQLRSVIEAYDGWSIVSADFSQIELRIAAALALRAIGEARLALSGDFAAPNWILEALRLGESDEELNSAAKGFEEHRNKIAAAWRGVCKRGTPMAEIFRSNLDPHLLTALGIAARKGAIELAGATPLAYLGALDSDSTKTLKKTLADDRQAAKPANFGLLYGAQAETLWRLGITDYGMRWSLEEATQVRDAWMHDYCDIAFWQAWVNYVHKANKYDTTPLYRRDRYSKELGVNSYQMRTSTTLLGKPICTPERRECLNHQDQATGAEMLSLALVNLGLAADYVINVVHDEIVAHAPDKIVQHVADDIERVMRWAADEILSPWGIPGDAEVKISKRWGK